MVRPQVLVIDDDQNISELLKRALSYAGFAVSAAPTGAQGLASALENPPDAVVLDVLLPDLNGFEVCRQLREGRDVPILMLTAKDEVSDRVKGLEYGADDYLVKPFALEELIARLKALLRRRAPAYAARLHFAGVVIDTRTREVRRDGRQMELTAREFDLLATLLSHPRQVLSRDQLLEQVWGVDSDVDAHVLEVYVRYLREKLEAAGERRLIHTVRGVGYVLKEPAG